MMPVPGACSSRWRALLFAVSALLLLAERAALLWCVCFHLQWERSVLAAMTFALWLPGSVVQVLSFRWMREDGEPRTTHTLLTHTLHLGVFKRFWDCAVCEWTARPQEVMREVDASALRLLEVLLTTLPQTLLQTHTLSEYGLSTPVCVCCAVSLLSLSWALVLFSRVCVLLRPGQLQMPPAALLAQLLWRTGVLCARVASLAFFTHTHGVWVIPILASHWLMASLWLVSQQTDIFTGQWSWRVFNLVLGGIHVFLFLNVKDGPSRFRMAGFYTVMLLENATLLLAASDILTDASWESLSLPAAVLCSFLLGVASLVLYYRFLHPKSTEISQGLQQHACLHRSDSSLSSKHNKFSKSPSPVLLPSLSLSGVSLSLPKTDADLHHHHWLLLRLALKTGDIGKINHAFGGAAAILPVDEKRESFESAFESRDDTERFREEFESVNEEEEEEEEDEGDSLEMESPLESPLSEVKRSSPEGKSVFGDSPEPHYCPTESSSTLYFSADPHSPSGSGAELSR